MKKILLVAALSLAAAPIAASAAGIDRSSAPVESAQNLAGGDGPTITALVALAGLIAAVIIVADGDDDAPVSP